MTSYSYPTHDSIIDVIRDAEGDRVETWTADHSALVSTRPATADETTILASIANETTIRDRAVQAITDNKTFLAISSPTNAQTLAQVKALTRQNNALIRLALRRFDAAD